MKLIRIGVIICVAIGIAPTGIAQNSVAQTTAQQVKWAAQAKSALFAQDYKAALEIGGKLADSATSDEMRLVAADTLLRSGDSKRAVELFDKYIEGRPESKPYLWQRGIALYFLGRYKDGAEQFEVHRKVNPNDVENAAWHFLCVAQRDSPEAARKLLLPAPDDSRPPMKEVLTMLSSGDTKIVTTRMNSFAEGSAAGKSAKFYGNFYLGLYADALDDQKTATKFLDAASKGAPKNYMGDLANVYAKHLKQ